MSRRLAQGIPGRSRIRLGGRPDINLPERHAQPVLFPPYDATLPAERIGLHDEFELVRNGRRVGDLERCAFLGQVSDGATMRTALELDRSAFQNATSLGLTLLVNARSSFPVATV